MSLHTLTTVCTNIQILLILIICSSYAIESTGNTVLVNTEPLLLWYIHKARFLETSGHNIFINWLIHNLNLCVFLFKDILFMYLYC